jgi:hypothetical protein
MLKFMKRTKANKSSGQQGEAWSYLQACRVLRQGVSRRRAGKDPSCPHCEARGIILCSSRAQACLCCPHQGYKQDRPKEAQDPPTPPSPSDQQWRLCPSHQSHYRDASHRRAVRRLWLPQPEVCPRTHLQTWIWQDVGYFFKHVSGSADR